MLKGIDVSTWNGKINWASMKSKINFAMIRLGYVKGTKKIDDRALYNMSECDRLGIPYGLYLYSYALNESQVIIEANHAIDVAKKGNPVLGIYFDMEDADGYKAKNNMNPYNNGAKLAGFCKTFIRIVKNAGYESGVYANTDYLNNVIGKTGFEHIWVASWKANNGPQDCPKGYNAEIWQYTDNATIDGKRFDCNYYINESRFKTLTTKKESDKESVKEEAVTKPSKPATTTVLKHKVGETVSYNKIYISEDDPSSGAKPYYKSGKITKIFPNSKHPYLIGAGIGFVDDNCITSGASSNTTFKKGDKVKLKKGSTWYNGTKVASFVFNVTLYVIGQDSRGVLVSTSKGGACTGVVKPDRLSKV